MTHKSANQPLKTGDESHKSFRILVEMEGGVGVREEKAKPGSSSTYTALVMAGHRTAPAVRGVRPRVWSVPAVSSNLRSPRMSGRRDPSGRLHR
jgi:hypothetical protein